MRILHAISGIDPRNGGPTNALVGLASAQVRAGLDVRVISTFKEQDAHLTAGRLKGLRVGVRMVGPATGKLSRHPQLRQALQEEIGQTDVLHVHAVWEEIQYQACRVARRLAKPYVYTPHGMLDPWNLSNNRLAKRLFLAFRMRRNLNGAALLHMTTDIERVGTACLGLTPPTVIEPLGLDWSEFADLPARGEFRNKHPQLGNRPIVLFLGRIDAGKGLEILIPALKRMTRRDATVVVAGPEFFGYKEHLRKMSAGVEDRILYTGMIAGRDKLAAIVDADVLCAPSYHENFGLAVIEALACGTPVVISNQVAIHPDITAGQVGAVVPLDPATLAMELDRWLSDPTLRSAASAQATTMARQRYDWDVIARHWVEHYARVMSERA